MKQDNRPCGGKVFGVGLSLGCHFEMSTSQLRASKKTQTLPEPTLPQNITSVLTSFPTFAPLAQGIMNVVGQSDVMRVGDISWKKFEDGFPNLMIHDVENLRSRDVVYLADFLNLETIFPQLAGSCFFSFLQLICSVFAFLYYILRAFDRLCVPKKCEKGAKLTL